MKKCCILSKYVLEDTSILNKIKIYCIHCFKSQFLISTNDWIILFDIDPIFRMYIYDRIDIVCNILPVELQLFLKLND